MNQLVLPWLIGAPLLGAALAFVIGPRHAAKVAALVIAVLIPATAAMLGLVWHDGIVRVAIGGWLPPLGIGLACDGVSALLIATTTIIYAAISLYAAAYLPRQQVGDRRALRHYWPLWLLLWAGQNAALLATDLFNLYVTIELMGLASVALVALAGGEALTAAVRYVLVTVTGSLLYLLGVALIYADHGVVDLATVAELATAAGRAQPATRAAIVLISVGLVLKAAIVPLHAWLPPAHAGTVVPISAALSGLVVEVFAYVLVRVWLDLGPLVAGTGVAGLLGLLGGAAIVWGSAQAIVQARIELIAAYSTVAQLGYLMLGLSLAAWSGLLWFVAGHALAKAALFLAAGEFEHAFGDDQLASARGAAVRTPITSFAVALAGLALIGLPPSTAFFGKWLLLSDALASQRWFDALVIIAGSLLAAAYIGRILATLLRTPAAEPPAGPRRELPAAMQLATLGLALLAATLGLASNPALELLGEPAEVR